MNLMHGSIAVATIVALCTHLVSLADGPKRETSGEMRRIVAQAICLGEAYPNSEIANDGAAVVAVYQGMLGTTVSVQDLDAVRRLAREARPAAPTPVGSRNLAIARCVLFAEQSNVRKLLGGPPGKN